MQQLTVASAVTNLHGVGIQAQKHLRRLGIVTISDLLWHIPFRYDDFRELTTIANLKIGQTVTISGTLGLIATRPAFRRRLSVTEVLVHDATGSIKVVWFNQPYLVRTLKPDDRVMLSGKVASRSGTIQLVSPSYEKLRGADPIHVGRLVPVYTTTAGLSQRQLRYFVSQALSVVPHLSDPLPEKLRGQEHLASIAETLATIHFPKDEAERDRALGRLKFDELLVFQLSRLLAERERQPERAPEIRFRETLVRPFVAQLPFHLTASQRRAAWEILQDLERSPPMNRLLEGDVGSGKTIVAALAALNATVGGWSVVVMAPTEILALQHSSTFTELFERTDLPILLWTHGFCRKTIRGRREELRRSAGLEKQLGRQAGIVIGTHALLSEGVAIPRLGLVVVDEQHRFGVEQRKLIRTKGGELVPHFLSLTATPIPRTLALSLAGDLKLSVLTTRPRGRKPIETIVASEAHRDRVYASVEREIAMGRQAFVLAPLIEPSDVLGIASATSLYEELQVLFPKRRISLVHGKLTGREKDAALRAFADGTTDLLVATPIVEVGIDVPNATVMVIEGAERFGLAQLHQLRGRVGRGEHHSRCFLLPQNMTPLGRKRLDAVAATHDGFRLAELDLQLRGPGDLVGTMQSGFLDFHFATLSDHALMGRALSVAQRLLAEDPTLSMVPDLRAQIRKEMPHKE